MRLATTLPALFACLLLGSASEAQTGDPLGLAPGSTFPVPPPAQAKAEIKVGTARNAGPAAKKGRSAATTARQKQAQARVDARARTNPMVLPPHLAPPDPALALANGAIGGGMANTFGAINGTFPITGPVATFGPVSNLNGNGGTFPYGTGSVLATIGGAYGLGAYGPAYGYGGYSSTLGNFPLLSGTGGTFPITGLPSTYGARAPLTASGGLVGTSDTSLIHGEDGDGSDPVLGDNRNPNAPRVDRVRGGYYQPGVGVPVRKGEKVHAGNYRPGFGVSGASTDAVAGGTYTPGYGVGSFDPRLSNQSGSHVLGGTYVPGYGVIGGGATTFGAVTPSYYGASGLSGNSYGLGGTSYYGSTGLLGNSYGAGGLVPNYGAVTNPSVYGAGGLTPGFGVSGVPPGYGATGGSHGFGSSIPSSYGASALPGHRR